VNETESLISDEPSRSARRSWYIVLAFEALHSSAGAARISLDDLDVIDVGRGTTRTITRRGRELRIDLDDRFQSKDHFRLQRSGASWELEDRESKNGTRCRGQRISRTAIANGDVIEAGASFFVVREASARVSDATLLPSRGDTLQTLHADFDQEIALLARLATSKLPVLVRGESGSGKEVAARTIHALSKRTGPLVAVNCGALPATLVEAELFGARRGAFSGAVEDRAGLVRAADNGTLFLDEIADLPLPAQASLLRFVQEGEIRALGANQTTKANVRVIAATHRDLDALVSSDEFRPDLAARLRGHVLQMPALRERREDLGVICTELLARISDQPIGIDRAAARVLFAHDWPENVRELEHALRYAIAKATTEITTDDLPASVRRPAADRTPNPSPRPEDQRARIVALLAEHDGNLSAVARALHTSRTQLRRLIERYGIDPAE
jgi:DNA-binding NtrC family response regulator